MIVDPKGLTSAAEAAVIRCHLAARLKSCPCREGPSFRYAKGWDTCEIYLKQQRTAEAALC